jgi:acyl carrier protein
MPALATSFSVDKVIEELRNVFEGKGIAAPELGAETILDGSLGLESMDFAELVVRLEGVFGKDPFGEAEIPEVRTVSDLALLYEI